MTQKIIYKWSQYKYVQNLIQDGKDYWTISLPGVSKISFPSERDAAIAVDKILIKNGKQPVNILKPLKKED